MRIHFICRGNSFRSRIAEAYLNSLHLDGVEVLSSGTAAAENASFNGPLPGYTKDVLEKHGILTYAKPSWDQLTPERISEDDVTVYLNQLTYDEATILGLAAKNYRVWNIPDTGEQFEGILTPGPMDPRVDAFAEANYQRIKEQVDKLVKEII